MQQAAPASIRSPAGADPPPLQHLPRSSASRGRRHGHAAAATVLLAHGAAGNLRNERGLSPLAEALAGE